MVEEHEKNEGQQDEFDLNDPRGANPITPPVTTPPEADPDDSDSEGETTTPPDDSDNQDDVPSDPESKLGPSGQPPDPPPPDPPENNIPPTIQSVLESIQEETDPYAAIRTLVPWKKPSEAQANVNAVIKLIHKLPPIDTEDSQVLHQERSLRFEQYANSAHRYSEGLFYEACFLADIDPVALNRALDCGLILRDVDYEVFCRWIDSFGTWLLRLLRQSRHGPNLVDEEIKAAEESHG